MARALLRHQQITHLQILRQLVVRRHSLALAVAVHMILAILAILQNHVGQAVMLRQPRLGIHPLRKAGAVQPIEIVRTLVIEAGLLPDFALAVQRRTGEQARQCRFVICFAAEEIRAAVHKRRFHLSAGHFVVAAHKVVPFFQHGEGSIQQLRALHLRLRRQDAQPHRQHQHQQCRHLFHCILPFFLRRLCRMLTL